MKNKECYYVKRQTPFDEVQMLYRIFNDKMQCNSTVNEEPIYDGVEGWIDIGILPSDLTRIPTWQAKCCWPNITKG